jgi:hypothetical protein
MCIVGSRDFAELMMSVRFHDSGRSCGAHRRL